MKPRIPNGGFVIAVGIDHGFNDAVENLKNSSATIYSSHEHGLILGAWKEYAGQGLWIQGNCGVAYDLDLTNGSELKKSLDISEADAVDDGYFIWLLYKKYGLDFIDRLRGSFGFALWDGQAGEAIVVTDPYGIKPVVYFNNTKPFVAASRIRHILLFPFVERNINPEAVYHYLFFHAICSPVSIYKGINKLEPGTGLRLRKAELAPFVHYDIKYRTAVDKEKGYWKDSIPARLESAVKQYVPLSSYEKTGCFLSGGTDSSSLAGFYTKLTEKPAQTFSIAFDEPGYNEIEYARIAARHFGFKAFEYWVTPGDILSFLETYAGLYDEPFGNSSVVPSYYCAKKAKEEGIEVLFGGDGGDEIFGGNQRYSTNLIFERYHSIPRIARKYVLEPLIRVLPDNGIFHKTGRYIRRANIPNPDRFFSYNLLAENQPSAILQPDFLSSIDSDCFMNLMRSHFNRIGPAHVTDALLYLDMKITITDNDLRKVTQMVEACGIRVRYPFLHRELVDFAACIPPSLKATSETTRVIFKEALKGFLPQEIIKKKKHGMGLPVGMWMKTDKSLNDLIRTSLFQKKARIHSYIQPEFLENIWTKMQSESTPYYGDNLWVYLILELWLSGHQ